MIKCVFWSSLCSSLHDHTQTHTIVYLHTHQQNLNKMDSNMKARGGKRRVVNMETIKQLGYCDL